ncbi:high affinity immunoglobulin epsilon receptor subunit gamma [Pezoporus occidentalis]|uniref:high affinity immunoglobulin epsilon receptor subunit gamma n=1 Tax=Pezoporus occidentalis TaxID=407982 RepID=UPI002F90739F
MGVLLLLLLLQTPAAEALMEPEFCYILDAILFLYGIILTTIYCRLKGLSSEGQETYETLEIRGS